MKRFTIRRNGMLVGTHDGNTKEEALDAMAVNEGFKSFADSGYDRDEFTAEEVKG